MGAVGGTLNDYIRRNLPPIVWELLFIIFCFLIPSSHLIYANFVFYLELFIYFYAIKTFTFKDWKMSLAGGSRFWKPVLLTVVAYFAAFALTVFLENLFPDAATGMIVLRADSWLKLLIFALSTIILPPVCEEAFYRASLISAKGGKLVLIATTLLSMVLYAAEHATAPFGILLAMIWAIPMSVAYIKTKNIYIVMTAHLIGNLFGNGFDVVQGFISLLK